MKFSIFNFQFSKILERIYPEPPIAGLEVSDSVISLVDGRDKSRQISLRLTPGIIEEGKLKNREGLKSALQELYRKLPSRKKKHLNIVLTIPANDIFVQTVTLPPLSTRDFEEAARLNLQMVSPLNLGQSYYDWQRLDDGRMTGKPSELLGAFAPREIIDGFVETIREVGFSVVAVEFASLSLVRELKRQKRIKLDEPYLVVEIRPEGITFILVREGQLLFHSFSPWSTFRKEGGEVQMKDFISALTDEINTISNFYGSHWGGSLASFVFITSSLQDEIKEALKGKSLFFLRPEELNAAAGAASRSLLQQEKEISLLGTSYLEIFRQNRALNFISLWRSILITTLGFLIMLSLGADLFLRQLARGVREADTLSLNEPGHKELVALREEASRFNELVALTKGIRGEESQIGPVADLINSLTGTEIKINRVYVPSSEALVIVSGVALDEQAAIEFKNRLAGEKSFAKVDLPLSGIVLQPSGGVAFTVYFQVVETQ